MKVNISKYIIQNVLVIEPKNIAVINVWKTRIKPRVRGLIVCKKSILDIKVINKMVVKIQNIVYKKNISFGD